MNNKLSLSVWALNLSAASLWDWFVAPPPHPSSPDIQGVQTAPGAQCCGAVAGMGRGLRFDALTPPPLPPM